MDKYEFNVPYILSTGANFTVDRNTQIPIFQYPYVPKFEIPYDDFKDAIKIFNSVTKVPPQTETPPEYLHVIRTLGNVIKSREEEIEGFKQELIEANADIDSLRSSLRAQAEREEAAQRVKAIACVQVITGKPFIKDFIHLLHGHPVHIEPTVEVLNRIREFYDAKDVKYLGVYCVTTKLGEPEYAKGDGSIRKAKKKYLPTPLEDENDMLPE